MEEILWCGEKELQELKKTLQEKERYKSVLQGLKSGMQDQQEKIEDYKKEIEQEVTEEVQKQREELVKPYYDEISSCENDIEKVKEAKNEKRRELIDNIIREEAEKYGNRIKNLEEQIKLVRKEENVPSVCLSRLFLAFFCPRTGMDALILVSGIVLLLLVLPLLLYYGIYGGNNKSALTMIYLVLIIFFYTLYLMINNLVKDKYLVGLNKVLNLLSEREKLELHRKQRARELENISDKELDLKEFDDEIARIQGVIGDLNGQKDMALVNFDSDERRKDEISRQVQEKHKSEMEQMKAELVETEDSYNKMQIELNKFLQEKNMEEKYATLLRIEKEIFNIKVIDELIFSIHHGETGNIREAIVKRQRKMGKIPKI